jgi:ubiquinol-cytochrome c reductase cytochrome b subunit
VRLTQGQLIREVIQVGGNMPAYGKNLSPAEATALWVTWPGAVVR